jgi:hypothetical protein
LNRVFFLKYLDKKAKMALYICFYSKIKKILAT